MPKIIRSKIIGIGAYLPERIVSNNELATFVDTSDEWIRSRSGITQRHLVAEGQNASDMGINAAKEAVNNASIHPDEIDLIIACTNSPDNSFPGVSAKIHRALKLKGAPPAFDLQAICSGFIYGMHVADSFIKSGQYKTILLVCAEKMSSFLNWQERSTAVLFGDGAGAVVLQANLADNSGIADSKIYAQGEHFDILYTDGGVGSNQRAGNIVMKGPELFKKASINMANIAEELLASNGLTNEDIDYFVPHQANKRIIDAVSERISFPQEKIILTVDKHANCSAASIPLALANLNKATPIKRGSKILSTAFGAGLSWGGMLIEW